MTKMNPEIKARWVAALRSGEYEQATGGLRVEGGFCCLGVLCDLYVKDGNAEWHITPYRKRGTLLGSSALAPDDVCQWAGLPVDEMGHVDVEIGGQTHSLPQHNDGIAGNESIQRRTFAEIADAIEEQL